VATYPEKEAMAKYIISDLEAKLQQTKIRIISSDKILVYTTQNYFCCGELNLLDKIFTHSLRTTKNLFRGSLGINAEIINIILPFFGVSKILIPFQYGILETTVEKWKALGITKWYNNKNTDKQILLNLNEINMNDAGKYKTKSGNTQLNLFGG
jgi:hypothetical protein